MSPRPLVRRTPDGRRYTTPSTMPTPPRPAQAPAPEPPEVAPPQKGNRRRKLTADDVLAIRADFAAGRWSQGDLAYIYGVTQSTISSVVNGTTHRDVQSAPREQD